jgi:cytochrome oxidase Cu insertion factor (SCO1/SenC/PrrC family)
MFSSVRVAHLGLLAVAAVFCACIAILGGRAADRASHQAQLAPQFSLISTEGQRLSLSSLRGKVVVLMFTATQCPYSNDYLQRLSDFGRRYQGDSRVQVMMIDTGARADDALATQRLRVQQSISGQSFPTLIDGGRQTAAAYDIVHTPTVCVIDPSGELRYRGAFDDNRDERLVSERYCEQAVSDLLQGHEPRTKFTQAFGGAVARSK